MLNNIKRGCIIIGTTLLLSGCQITKDQATSIDIETLFEKDFILYNINCGSNNKMSSGSAEPLGLYHSKWDQVYGKDILTGMKWGYKEATYMVKEGELESEDKLDSKWSIKEGIDYQSEETGFLYNFEVPKGSYIVSCGFYNPFSARTIDIVAEDSKVVEREKLLKYKLVESIFEVEVTDGEMNLKVYNPNRGKDGMKNPILSYITVRQKPDYSKELLELLLDSQVKELLAPEYYTDNSYDAWEQTKIQARTLLNNDKATKEMIEESYSNLKESYEALVAIEVYTSFRPGLPWNDTDGDLIQAHGGQVQRIPIKNEETGEVELLWWWVGEDKTLGYRGGIRAYSSKDLYNWKSEGIVMRNVSSRKQLETEDYFVGIYEGYSDDQLDCVYESINDTTSVIERPKMIYNEKTDKYVIWFHADGPLSEGGSNYEAAAAGVAISDSPKGPFRFIDRYRLNTCPEGQEDMFPQSKGMARDMNLFVDDDGEGYIIYSSEENLTMYISRLNDDYTYLDVPPEEAVHGKDFVRLYPGAQREAPALFKRDGKYYMMTSGATGWNPNQARYWVADSILGKWEDMGDPCIGDGDKTTFGSQSTCVFLVDEKTQQYIYMGDRWNEEDLSQSSYVWLPITFGQEGKMQIEWVEEWNYEQIAK